MKIKGKTKKLLIVTIISSYFATMSSAFAFVWPVINLQKIATTVKNINNMISQVTNVTGQIKTTVGKINAIGDVIGSIEKYADKITSKINEIKQQIVEVIEAVKSAVETVKKAVDDVKKAIDDTTEAIKSLVDDTISTVEGLIDDGATKEEVIDVVENAEEEAEKIKNEGLENIDNTGKDVSQTLDEASETLRTMIDAVNEYDGINDQQKEDFSQRASDIEKRIEELKVNLGEIINNAKENYNEQFSMFVTEAFNEYTQAINDYYSGKITKEDLEKAGAKLNESVSSLDVQIDDDLISDLVSSAQNIANDIETLENDILDAISNNKDYSDDAFNNILDTEIKYSFSYSYTNELANATVVSSDGERFLVSCELLCDKNENELTDNTNPGKEITLQTLIEYLNDAKEMDGKKCVEKCNEDEAEREKIRKEGIFTHITKDYSLANLANVTQTKQYASNWINSEEEGYNKLLREIQKNGDNNRNAESQRKLIDLEIPRAWNFIRRVDALNRAKDMVNYYNTSESTYLHDTGYYDDKEVPINYLDVIQERRGIVSIKTKTSNNQEQTDEVELFPDALFYYCNYKGEDIYSSEKDGKKEMEEKIKDCMYKFALGMSLGTTTPSDTPKEGENTEYNMTAWNIKSNMSVSDAAIKTLAFSIEDNNNSIFVEDGDVEGTFQALTTEVGQTNDLRDEYITGAFINSVGTTQILDIIDSEAQALQTEILMILPEIDYNYFSDKVEE